MLTRRQLVKRGVASAATLSIAEVLAACGGGNDGSSTSTTTSGTTGAQTKPGYGPLTDEAGPLLTLPAGFRYVRFGEAGSKMSDGLPTPTCHDGAGAFKGKNGQVILMRNQEGFHIGRALSAQNAYDPVAQGGVTVSYFDLGSERLTDSALVLNGTDNNCNGGVTPWGTWLSGEENTVGKRQGFGAEHGYVFEVPIDAKGPVEPVPLKAMGRFVHEACPVDPRSGIVYMTEDNGEPGDGFYRFLPTTRGKLQRGGELQMLAVVGEPEYDARAGHPAGEDIECEWVTIDEPDPGDADESPEAVYMEGRKKGGIRFVGLEGATFRGDSVYFVGSEAGEAEEGQIFRFTPDPDDHKRGTLTLLYESPNPRTMNQPDGITVSPRGGILLAEDGDGEDSDGGDNFLRGLTPDGEVFDFAGNPQALGLHRNLGDDLQPLNKRRFDKPPEPGQEVGQSEFSGPVFSPDGNWLFVSLQYPGETFAITGPWERGWL